MGGTASKPSVSNSKENAELNNKPSPKETPKKPVPYIIENVTLPPDKSPKRRRRFSKKPRDTDYVVKTPSTPQVAGADDDDDDHRNDARPRRSSREPGKIETLVRDGVTNISRTLRDWTMISSRGSRSAAHVIPSDGKRSSSPTTISPQRLPNQFNFHHASYLAQSKQEKQSSVDFSAPRHLNSATRQQSCGADYASAASKQQRDGLRKPPFSSSSQHLRCRQPSPDNIPAPRNKYGRKKDTSPYYKKTNNNSRQNSPSYLYSLELNQGSSEHCPEASPKYITRASRAQSPDYMAPTYRASNVVIEKPSRDKVDTVDTKSSSEWTNTIGERASSRRLDTYSRSVIHEMVPIYLPSVQQDMVVQRVEVKQDLDYAVIKPKTICVNGIEYVRKKSRHPLLKQLLTIDKNEAKVSTMLREKPERDQTGRSRKAAKEVKEEVNVTNENRSKSYEGKEVKTGLENGQIRTVDKDVEKREIIQSKTNGREVETKEGSKPVNVENVSDGSGTKCNERNETTKPDTSKTRVETKELEENERKIIERSSKRDETSTKVIDKKENSKRDSNSEVVHEKKDTNKHEGKPNSRESKDGTGKDANTSEKNAKDVDKMERVAHDFTRVETTTRSGDDKETLKRYQIQQMPIAVSSTGRVFLPSTKFSATPMASMCGRSRKVSACASEKSYSRISRTERLSPNRLRRISPRRADQSPPRNQAARNQDPRNQGTKKPSAELQKASPPKEGKENNENTNTGKTLATWLLGRSPNRSPNRSPRSTSPSKNNTTGDGKTSPRANKSRETPVLVCSREPRMAKAQTPVLLQGDAKPNCNVDTRSNTYPNQACKRATEGEKKPNKPEQRKLAVEKSASGSSDNSSSKEAVTRASQGSIDVWYSKSVRSKNKIFETIIESTSSEKQTSPRAAEHRRTSRRSSPRSQHSDTPFSKEIKLKYRAISAKRLSRPDLGDKEARPPVVVPKVFTPWDSCLMFKPKHTRPASPRRRNKSRSPAGRSRRRTPAPDTDKALDARGGNLASTTRPKQCPKSPPTREETTTDKGDRLRPPPPPPPDFPRENCQSPTRNHHRDFRNRQVADCSCGLGSCNCIEVQQQQRSRCSRSRNEDTSPVSSRYSKLNRETLQDFERKFKTTHVYRSVTGVSCKQSVGKAAGKASPVPTQHNKERAEAAGAKRQKRCPSCGKCSDASGGKRGERAARCCAACGGPLDKSGTESGGEETGRCSHCGERHDMRGCKLRRCVHCGGECCGGRGGGKDDRHGSGQGSSSGLSATSGQVPPYRKVLKMFETRSKQHAAAAAAASVSSPRYPSSRPKSGGVHEVGRPASHFDRHKVPGRQRANEEAVGGRRPPDEPPHPRDVIIERRRPARRRDPRDDAHGDGDDDTRVQANDPHFNRSELELFKNARLQWMARDQQKRPRQRARGGDHLHTTQQVRSQQTPSPTLKGILKRGRSPPPPSPRRMQDAANGK